MIGRTSMVKRNSVSWRGSAWLPPSIAPVWGHPAGSCQERRWLSCRIHWALRRPGDRAWKRAVRGGCQIVTPNRPQQSGRSQD
jgi:hypothetical protein